MGTTKTIDMTQGPVLKKLWSFVAPAILSNLVQQTYTIADRVVVGRFAADGTTALAAVGSTGQITSLFVYLFLGLSLGANVTCSNFRGAKDNENIRKCMHTAIPFGLLCGIFVMFLGEFAALPMLKLLGTPEVLMESALRYLRIVFLGTPASLTFNFGANLLRSHGDSRRPMYILALTGLVNVCLNMVLVIGFDMSVAGVAWATVIAHYLSAGCVLWILFSPKDEYKMSVKNLCLNKRMIAAISKIGIPAGLNSTVFIFSNTFVISGVNSFNSAVISAGKTAANDLGAMLYQVIMGMYTGCVNFSGQCFGAKKYRRIDRLAVTAMGLGSAILFAGAVVYTIFGRQLMGIFNSDPAVIEAGMGVLMINVWFYVLYLATEVPLGCIRGMRKASVSSMLNVVGICLPRILWVSFVFPLHRSVTFLYVCYPISWFISAAMQWGYYFYVRKKVLAEAVQETA